MFNYHADVSTAADQPDWDLFLSNISGVYYVQTSWWGQLKAQRGAKAVRLVIKQKDKIVAGVQIIMKSISKTGIIVGYVPKGPVFMMNDPHLTSYLINQLHQLARAYHIQYLIVQPHENDNDFAQYLLHSGFSPSSTEISPTATIQVDLRQKVEQLKAGMKKKSRCYLRRGLREGLTGRQGTVKDIPTFYRLLVATAERQGFTPFSKSYFTKSWALFKPRGHIALFLVEYNGEPVSGQVVVAFGDSVVALNSGWSGEHARLGPNYTMDWVTMKWAKSQGYHYYNLGGLQRKVASDLLQGKIKPDPNEIGANYYKLNFGGQIELASKAYGYVYNPVLRWGYTNIFHKIEKWPPIQMMLARFR